MQPATLMALKIDFGTWGSGVSAASAAGIAPWKPSVAFFVDGTSAAVCHGRGEIIEPLDVPLGLRFVIVRPRTGLSTGAGLQARSSPGC